MNQQKIFTDAVVACLCQNSGDLSAETLRSLVAWVLGEQDNLAPEQPKREPLSDNPPRSTLEACLEKIRAVLPAEHDRIALIAGGATKIKGYVFEAPKLPEIRGASALLDWVNDVGLRELWINTLGAELGEHCIIYASGGGFLAFAPASLGDELANDIEHCYTEHTLTANSVAVAKTFSLLELRYGRLFDEDGQLHYWVNNFRDAWKRGGAQRNALNDYYYPPEGVKADDMSDAALDQRFFNRKTFGELVTLLATMTNRRRDERATHGDVRSMPFYQMTPWAAKCDSSDIRPAVVRTTVGDEIGPREMSRSSGFKRASGQFVKNDSGYHKLAKAIEWSPPPSLQERAWNNRWLDFLKKHPELPYAQSLSGMSEHVQPASDVHEIGDAANGYIGVIYADGNNVGRLIATLKTPQDYQEKSQILSTASTDTIFRALANHLRPARVRISQDNQRANSVYSWVHPFEILTIGGDDLFIIVPGNKALDIALMAGSIFEADIAEKIKTSDEALSTTSKNRYRNATHISEAGYRPSIGLSAGVIIAQETAPIFFLRDLVEELLKNAKKLAKANAATKNKDGSSKKPFYGGAVDFMVMKSITMVTDKITTFRRQALGDYGNDSERRLTARPYTWHEFAGLLDTIRALKQARVPRSQLYRLRRALDAQSGNTITPSVMEYLYTRTRMSPTYSQALQTFIEQPWCWDTSVANRSGGLPPWMPLSTKGWETIWPDMLEAYEMVPTEEQP